MCEPAKKMKIPKVIIPYEIFSALKILYKHGKNANPIEYEDYVKIIKSLPDTKQIKQEDYVYLFAFSLYLEQYELFIREWERYQIKNYIIHNCSRRFQVIDISTIQPKPVVIELNSIVSFYENDTNNRYQGIVTFVNKDYVTVMMSSFTSYVCAKKFKICFSGSTWTLRCCFHALTSKTLPFNIIFPKVLPLTSKTIWEYNNIAWINANITKNDKQMQAVKNILNKSAHPAPYIVFGPPGTGKTATLVEAICQILEKRPMDKVLVCASSNNAVDEIAVRLRKQVSADLICRLYATSRQEKDIKKEIRNCSIYISTVSAGKLKKNRIILTTLITSMRLVDLNLKKNYFSYIFIDEASQIYEPEMLIPFMLLNEINTERINDFQTQVVIAGDPYQLGPTVFSKYVKHILGKSMLERLMNDCDPYKKNDNYNPRYITKLVKNYRSHNAILKVPNQRFYHNELEYCAGDEVQMALNWSELPNKQFPVIFQAVQGKEERSPTKSVYNMTEVQTVVKYVEMLIGADFKGHIVSEKDIGIITPFAKQQSAITKALAARNWKQIFIGTTEIFQGRECNVVIMSTVRSQYFSHNGKKHIGFLSDPKRFNVTVTRAKALLIIIGNPMILRISENWDALYSHCIENGGYVEKSIQLDEEAQLKSSHTVSLSTNKSDKFVDDSLESIEIASTPKSLKECINALEQLILNSRPKIFSTQNNCT